MPRIKLKQDHGLLRQGSYPQREEQLGAFAKILRAIVDSLPADARATIPDDALAILSEIEGVKQRFPKTGRRR